MAPLDLHVWLPQTGELTPTVNLHDPWNKERETPPSANSVKCLEHPPKFNLKVPQDQLRRKQAFLLFLRGHVCRDSSETPPLLLLLLTMCTLWRAVEQSSKKSILTQLKQQGRLHRRLPPSHFLLKQLDTNVKSRVRMWPQFSFNLFISVKPPHVAEYLFNETISAEMLYV